MNSQPKPSFAPSEGRTFRRHGKPGSGCPGDRRRGGWAWRRSGRGGHGTRGLASGTHLADHDERRSAQFAPEPPVGTDLSVKSPDGLDGIIDSCHAVDELRPNPFNLRHACAVEQDSIAHRHGTPQADGRVPAPAGERLPVRAEGDAGDIVLMPAEWFAERLARRRVPHADGVVPAYQPPMDLERPSGRSVLAESPPAVADSPRRTSARWGRSMRPCPRPTARRARLPSRRRRPRGADEPRPLAHPPVDRRISQSRSSDQELGPESRSRISSFAAGRVLPRSIPSTRRVTASDEPDGHVLYRRVNSS